MIGRESVEYRDVILVTRFISSGDMIMQIEIIVPYSNSMKNM